MAKCEYPVFAAIVFALLGFALSAGPAQAQQAARSTMPTITVTAAPLKNIREIMRLTVQGHKFLAISASVPVPYGDLNLSQESGANELGRRIRVAARLACQQLDIAYPPHIYAVIGSDDCVRNAADDGLAEAGTVIAAAKR
ncbi:MAG: UrcA family protein [Rhodospirillaceae bacterium]